MRAAYLALLLDLAVLSACGGRAALEAYVLGPGGTGGSTTTTTTSNTSTIPTLSTTTTWTTTTSFTYPTGSSTWPYQCDQSGDCDLCAECAVQYYCEQQVNDCVNHPGCNNFMNCIEGECAPDYDPDCLDQCAMQYPKGATLYQAAITCIYCSCQIDCDYQWCDEG